MSDLCCREGLKPCRAGAVHHREAALANCRIRLIANPKAGGFQDPRSLDRIVEVLAARNLKPEAVLADGADPAEAARAAVADGVNLVIAAGGDGTVSSVASAVVDSGATLGVLPTGTLNHFAKDLRIPLQLEAAADVIAGGNVCNVDVGEVNGRIFINNSSLGIYPRIVIWRDQHRKFGYGRWGSLVRAIIAVLRRLPFVQVSLTAGKTHIDRVTPLIFIGNNEYEMEGLNAGTRQRLDSGRLFVCIANAYTGVGLIRLSVSALLGRLRRMGQFEVLCATDARLETLQRHVRVSFDGEVAVMETPLVYRVRPAALRVIGPVKEEASEP